jgi:eukaryotic-like serine/threonine-protein kinase
MDHNSPMQPRIGSFVLGAALGAGGMGTVWSAVHAPSGQSVAVKLLRASLAADPDGLLGFEDEVRAVAALDHPNVVRVYDCGRVGADLELDGATVVAGSPWVAMELCRRGSVANLGLPVAWSDARSLARGLFAALGHAHARGILHRDVKPGNLLLGAGGACLTDFGLALLRGREALRSGGVEVTGTPPYMAPEQFVGDLRALGPATDLYGAACLLWTLLCGTPPYGRGDRSQMQEAHLAAPVPPLRAGVAVPRALEAWFTVALAKDPARRFQSAAHADWALDQVGEADQAAAGPDAAPSSPGGGAVAGPFVSVGTLSVSGPSLYFNDDSFSLMQDTTATTEGPSHAEPVGAPVQDEGDRDPLVEPAPAAAAFELGEAPPFPLDWRRPSAAKGRATLLAQSGLGVVGMLEPALCGREDEQDRLWATLHHVVASRQPRAVVLTGPSGVGKSRLARWTCERAAEVGVARSWVARHDPPPGGRDGVGPMLARWLRCDDEAPGPARARAARALRALGMDNPNQREVLIVLALGRDAVAGPAEVGAALVAGLRREAGAAAMVLWLDDVQWGGHALALAATVLGVPDLPVLVILTARDESLVDRPVDAAELRALQARAATETLALAPLGPAASARLVSQVLDLDAGFAAALEARVAGNPLFALELVGDWVRRGLLQPGPAGFRPVEGADLVLPPSIEGLWSERLAAIDGDLDPRLLELAAVMAGGSRELLLRDWRAALRCLGREPTIEDENLLVHRLVDARLGQVAPGRRGEGFGFVHAMVAEALGRRAEGAGRLVSLHGAAAEALRDSVDADAKERRARHLLMAGEAAGALPPLLDTASARSRVGDWGQALGLYDDAHRAAQQMSLPIGDPRWADINLGRAKARSMRGEYDLAFELLDASINQAGAGWERVLPRLYNARAVLRRDQGQVDAALDDVAQAIAGSRLVGDLHGVATAQRTLAMLDLDRGALDDAERSLVQAFVGFNDCADLHLAATCQLLLFGVARMRGALDQAEGHNRRASSLFAAAGSRFGEAECLGNAGEICRLRGDFTGAEHNYRETLALQRARGAGESAITELNLGLVLLRQGRVIDARQELEAARRGLDSQGRRPLAAQADLGLAVCAAWEGDDTTCRSLSASAESAVDALGLADPDLLWLAKELASTADEPCARLGAAMAREQELRLGAAEAAWPAT